MATGWLGWTPAVAWSTPIPELLLALDARIEWANMTNPFGGKPKKGAGRNDTRTTERMSPAEMRKALRGR